ncbi:MAG: hypothetical protein QSU88_09410, partial [Candidatus Methanoperedens sp.]|nr:hypothetical protein [Candidatus Methanoperedens sp.]
INIFTQDFAPLKTSKTSAQLATEPVVINLTSFEPGSINRSGPPPDIKIRLLKSRPECDVPYPAPNCNLFDDSDGEKNMADFNPFK